MSELSFWQVVKADLAATTHENFRTHFSPARFWLRAIAKFVTSPAVRVVLRVPEDPVVRVVQENPVALAVPENPAVPGPETALAAVPERGPVAVPLRTKSVTAPHPRGLVPLLAGAEDLVGAAETTRDPAATEAATAWVAAV